MVGSSCKKETEMPKLYLRPKSADCNFSCSSKEISEVLCDRETHSRSALGAYEDEKLNEVCSRNENKIMYMFNLICFKTRLTNSLNSQPGEE